MTLPELLKESITVLKTNKMRTGLSALGIIIGIGSVITLMTLGEASQQQTINRITALGSNMLTIRPGRDSTLTYEDTIALTNEKRITTVNMVAAEYTANAQVAFERNTIDSSVSGVTPDFFNVRNINVEYGTPISQSDIELLNKIAVVGPGIAEELFGTGANPLGKSVKINGHSFRVTGITKEKGTTGRFSTDDGIYIPLTTAQRNIFGIKDVSAIYVNVSDEKDMDVAENQIGYFLLELRGISDPSQADFSISSSSDLIETVSDVTATFTTLLTGIAAISLVVGGIGIMNIMLVTVTERTREIGIRKALGAKRKIIVAQFLTEAIILTIIGGIIGVIMGISISAIVTNYMNLPSIISIKSIGLAVAVSCTIGIIFGWYPAQKASKLQPIEALRYE